MTISATGNRMFESISLQRGVLLRSELPISTRRPAQFRGGLGQYAQPSWFCGRSTPAPALSRWSGRLAVVSVLPEAVFLALRALAVAREHTLRRLQFAKLAGEDKWIGFAGGLKE
jgi:hypothetical protein